MRYLFILPILCILQIASCTSAANHTQSFNDLRKIQGDSIRQDTAIKPISNPQEIFLNGYQSYQSNDWGNAVYFFEQVPDSYILSDYAIYYKASALSNRERYYEALLSFDKIAKVYKDSPLVPLSLLKIGGILSNTGNYQKAVEYFQNFIDTYPNHKEMPQALYKLAINFENIGELDNAQKALKQLWIEYPADKYALLTAKPLLTADETYKRLLKMFKMGEYKIIIKESISKEERFIMLNAKSFYHTKDYDRAIKDLKDIINNSADNRVKEEAMLWLGKAYSNIKDAEKSQTAYRELLNVYPKGSYADEAVYKLSILAKEQGETASALKMLEKLIKEYPSSQFRDDSIWQTSWIHYEKGGYKEALKYLELLQKSSADRFKKRAVYWHGRVLLKLGNKDEAVNIFKKLYVEEKDMTAATISEILPSYYEMLARKILIDLGIDHVSDCGFQTLNREFEKKNTAYYPPVTASNPLAGDARPATENIHLKKADELLAINLKEQAYMELDSLGAELSASDIIRAGILYKKAGNINRSHNIGLNFLRNVQLSTLPFQLSTLLSLAYPLGYQNIVDEASGALQIDPYLVYAVITQESAFNETAVSRAGALGLMQVMPKTGKAVSAKLSKNMDVFKKEDLFLPEINIILGTRYLKELMEEFKGNTALALAAYNAGPPAVKSWLKKGNIDTDEFVENIPYNETRRYVERVLSVYETYKAVYSNGFPIADKKDYTLTQAAP